MDDPTLKDCCKDEANLIPEPSEIAGATMRRCKVCKCRHFEMVVDPATIGVRGASL